VVKVHKTIRFISKALLSTLAGLFCLILVWFIANRTLDQAPDRARPSHVLAPQDRIPDSRNIAAGILGLSAPPGTDFVQHGAKVMALYRIASWDEVQAMLKGPTSLRPTIESTDISCWLALDLPAHKGCLPFEQAPVVLKQNSELLDRYHALADLDALQAEDNYYNSSYFAAVKLAIADVYLDMRAKNYEPAYQKWRSQFSYARRALRGFDTWVGKTIQLVVFGYNFSVFEDLIVNNPDLARVHRDELLQLLTPQGIASFNTDGLVRAEYSIMERAFNRPNPAPSRSEDLMYWLAYHLGQKNRIVNKFASFDRDYGGAMRLPWPDMQRQLGVLREKYISSVDNWDFFIDPFGSLFVAVYVAGHVKTGEMVKQMHISEGRLRLGTLLIQLINANVSDADIPRFLSNAAPVLTDPFSGKPMSWDSKTRRIYFSDPDEKCSITYVRVPDRRNSGSAKTPRTDSWNC
jgi:hypothetical protein